MPQLPSKEDLKLAAVVVTAVVIAAADILTHHSLLSKPKGSGPAEEENKSTEKKKDDSGGGKKMTEHGQERADEAKSGDSHREVGDANRVKSQGRSYTDSDTGNNIHVKGDRVVITDSEGNQVSQFKNTRANTAQRVQDGKWIPK
jgi:hypothetical protein